jgi:hypothetical protein
MKLLHKFRLLTIFLPAFLLFSFIFKEESVGKVSLPLGNVLKLGPGQTRFSQATLNMPVQNGDKIETKKDSRCELTFNDGTIVRIDQQSIYTVEKALFSDNGKQVESNLSIGKLWANVKKLFTNRDTWKLRTPAAVVAVRGTIYRMNAGADSSTQVLVYEGDVEVRKAQAAGGTGGGMGLAPGKPQQVQGPVPVQGPKEVSMEEWVEIVKAMEQIIVRPDGSYAKSGFNPAEDSRLDWVRWNKERDAMLEKN